jgi:hypothetical protein
MRRTDVRTAITPILPGALTPSKNQKTDDQQPMTQNPQPMTREDSSRCLRQSLAMGSGSLVLSHQFRDAVI